MITYYLCTFLALLLGIQIQSSDWKLLSGKYNYRIGLPQYITYAFTLIALATALRDIITLSLMSELVVCVAILAIFFISELILAHINPKVCRLSWYWRFMVTWLCALITYHICILFNEAAVPYLPFVLAGIYLRNTPFGITHGKDLWIASHMKRNVKPDFFVFNDGEAPDCSHAGCKQEHEAKTKYDVTEHGILANSRYDQSRQIQSLIDMVGQNGGGIIYFPKGKYFINTTGEDFLQINYSNIILEGEVDSENKPLAELVNCSKTSRGKKNPWISPFMITTGEALQPSNEFWGLQFRKQKKLFTQSNSLSDPGSDGSILTPEFATLVTKDSAKGDAVIHVEDSSKVGKYIVLGLYNTTKEGNLIQDILGMDLRPEWIVANRAGEEEAPSYQWLIEVKNIIDEHTIELVRPLLRDCEKKYEPAIFNVEMLENIHIRNLIINSRWSGLFRHHGFPIYYSISQSQEMDYGWNAINMKRVAHGEISNVIIKNFTNPLYVMDSRNVTVKDILVKGYDGHQGIKIYMHACDNLFENIIFENHYADMMGGEGNAYANVFRNISYLNPVFKPVDYDFHGFSEGPMSPPADNIFTHIYGFRYMKSAGSITHLPSCAQNNIWTNTITEGEKEGDYLFYAMTYRQKKGFLRIVTAVGYSVACIQKTHNLSPKQFLRNITEKLKNIDKTGIERCNHYNLLFPKSKVVNIKTTGVVPTESNN